VQRPATQAGDALAERLHDAARTPGGHASLLALPESEGEIAWVLREAPAVLAVGAQSSLTGGATPFGEWLLGTERLDALRVEPEARRAQAAAGVALTTLQDALDPHGLWYPPVPTFRGAFVGGVLSTNAAGASTFKYGATRAWVEGLTVVLASGAALDLERGQCRAHPDGWFEIAAVDGSVTRVPLPAYRVPAVPKVSAGYQAEPGMDLVDLFVGSEGTLGVISQARLRLLPRPAQALAWITLDRETAALALVGALREAARATWRTRDPRAVDVAAIESLDRRCLELLRADGREVDAGLDLRGDTALLIDLELPPDRDQAEAALEAFAALVGAHADAGRLLLAAPGDTARRARLLALREAVPEGVNRRVAEVQRRDPDVHKVAADMIVPFEALPEMVGVYREGFARRGLDHALWGHVSDGNLHANVIPRSSGDVRAGHEAILEFGRHAARLGGCPLSEHGVGRNAVKQELLRRLYGDAGIAAMRAVKAALDPRRRLAPGVLFPAG
jgi:D-lactate dehydrogenase (cytochrome)